MLKIAARVVAAVAFGLAFGFAAGRLLSALGWDGGGRWIVIVAAYLMAAVAYEEIRRRRAHRAK